MVWPTTTIGGRTCRYLDRHALTIVDNLQSTDPLKSLSANQGRRLNELADTDAEPNAIFNPACAINIDAKGAVPFASTIPYVFDGVKVYATTDNRVSARHDLDAGQVLFNNAQHHLGLYTTNPYTISGANERFIAILPVPINRMSALRWGTAKARNGKLAFSAIANQSGTYSGAIQAPGGARSFPFSFSLTANTEKRVYIPVTRDTTADMWTDVVSIIFSFGCGTGYQATAGEWIAGDKDAASGETRSVGSAGARLCISDLDFYPDDFGIDRPFRRLSDAEYARQCEQQAFKVSARSLYARFGSGPAWSTTNVSVSVPVPDGMGAVTAIEASGTFYVSSGALSTPVSGALAVVQQSSGLVSVDCPVASGLVVDKMYDLVSYNDAAAYLTFFARS